MDNLKYFFSQIDRLLTRARVIIPNNLVTFSIQFILVTNFLSDSNSRFDIISRFILYKLALGGLV